MSLPSSGLHYGMSFNDYRELGAVNIHGLMPMHTSELHCRWALDNNEDATDSMDVGSATHVAILEPSEFQKRFFIAPEYDARTTAGKEIAARCEQEAAGRTVIRKKKGDAVDADDVTAMAEAVWRNPAAAKLLAMAGQCEVTGLWKDPITGTVCKLRVDKLCTADRPIIVELKTTKSAAKWAFGKDAAKLHYDAQAEWYRWGVCEITGKDPLHAIICVENKGPWATAVYTLDDAARQNGVRKYREWLDRYADAVESGRWPGYSDKVETLSLPW